MDIKIAAKETGIMIANPSILPQTNPEFGKDHLQEMVDKIVSGEIEGEKAHRWLGWIQGCLCVGGNASLEDLKMVNYPS